MTVAVTEEDLQPKQPDKTLGELLGELSSEIGDVFSTQIEIAKVELRKEAKRAGKGAGMLGAAGFTAYLAILLLAFAAAWGLSEVVPEGVAFLIVGLVFAGVAAVLALRGRDELKTVEPLPETVETVQEDVQWARQLKR